MFSQSIHTFLTALPVRARRGGYARFGDARFGDDDMASGAEPERESEDVAPLLAASDRMDRVRGCSISTFGCVVCAHEQSQKLLFDDTDCRHAFLTA